MFYEIIVIDYITDFKSLSTENLKILSDGLSNSQFLSNCPNGTIIGIPIDGSTHQQKKIYYPMLSHISMPIKSGERAWAFDQKTPLVSYWISRKVQNISAEDLNFTHDDRARVHSLISNSPDAIQKNSSTFYDASMSVLPLKSVRSGSISRAKEFIGEPVSSVKSKSNDLTLQGSNGTLINLTNFSSTQSATVDIIAGLSQTLNLLKVTNSENYEELVKLQGSIDPSPDDSSRVIISQKFNADAYYKLPDDDAGKIPTISLKTDAARIISKNDLKIIVGQNENQSKIYVKNDGNIIITPGEGKKIKLSGDSADQPYIRYDEFRQVITELENAITNLQAGLVAVAAVVDSIAGGAASSAIATPNATVTSSISKVEVAMKTIGSTKILGS
jgi:hypothetical protein